MVLKIIKLFKILFFALLGIVLSLCLFIAISPLIINYVLNHYKKEIEVQCVKYTGLTISYGSTKLSFSNPILIVEDLNFKHEGLISEIKTIGIYFNVFALEKSIFAIDKIEFIDGLHRLDLIIPIQTTKKSPTLSETAANQTLSEIPLFSFLLEDFSLKNQKILLNLKQDKKTVHLETVLNGNLSFDFNPPMHILFESNIVMNELILNSGLNEGEQLNLNITSLKLKSKATLLGDNLSGLMDYTAHFNTLSFASKKQGNAFINNWQEEGSINLKSVFDPNDQKKSLEKIPLNLTLQTKTEIENLYLEENKSNYEITFPLKNTLSATMNTDNIFGKDFNIKFSNDSFIEKTLITENKKHFLSIGKTQKKASGTYNKNLDLTFETSLENLIVKNLKAKRLTLQGKISNTMNKWNWNLVSDSKDFFMDQKFPLDLALAKSNFSGAVKLAQNKIEWSNLKFKNPILKLEAHGHLIPKTNSSFSKGHLELALAPKNLSFLFTKGNGRIIVPFEISAENLSYFQIQSQVDFKEVSFKKEKFEIENLDGTVSLSEKISYQNGKILFIPTLEQDSFRRVDYGKLDPLIKKKEILTIKKIKFDNLVGSNFQTKINLQQNLFQLDYFHMYCLDGEINGQFLLNVNPKEPKIAIIAKVQNINPLKYFDEKASKEELSVQNSIKIDLKKALVEGKVFVPKISKNLLLKIFDYLDPKYEDEKILQARLALKFSYPQGLWVNMHHGMIDLKIKISALNTPIEINSFPLTTVIQSQINEILSGWNF